MNEEKLSYKILKIINFTGKKDILKIVFFVLIGASLEVAGVGSIGPFIAIMLNPELVNTNDILRLIVENSPKSVQENFVFYFGLFLVVLFFIVNSFLAFLFYYIEKISREKPLQYQIVY